jgi:hypothetical protein
MRPEIDQVRVPVPDRYSHVSIATVIRRIWLERGYLQDQMAGNDGGDMTSPSVIRPISQCEITS